MKFLASLSFDLPIVALICEISFNLPQKHEFRKSNPSILTKPTKNLATIIILVNNYVVCLFFIYEKQSIKT